MFIIKSSWWNEIPSYDKGDSLLLEAVLLRELKNACALKAIQGQVRRHPLLILYFRTPVKDGPEMSISRYFRKVHRSVKTFKKFLIAQRQVHKLAQMWEEWEVDCLLGPSLTGASAGFLLYADHQCASGGLLWENNVWWPGPLLGISS